MLTCSLLPPKALRRECQANVAHLILDGNSAMPAKTSKSPKSSSSPWPFDLPVTMPWKEWKSYRASSLDIPSICSVIIEAEARDIAQPVP